MGVVENSQASLGIYGDNLDPEEITKLLGCEPTKARKKGDVLPKRREKSITRSTTTGFWGLRSELPESAELETKITAILDKVTADLNIWGEINQRYSTRIFCGLFFTNTVNEGFGLSANLLRRLADRGLKIEFDIYTDSEAQET